MKKTFIILIIAILCTVSGFVYADGVETQQITSMEIIENCDNVTVGDLRFTLNGEKVSVWVDFITPSDAALLVGFFSDDNLLYSGEVDEETLAGKGRPEEGETEIYIENGLSVYLTFNDEKVLVEVIDVDNLTSYCGFFTYRNENGYNELMKLLEEIYSKTKPLQDEKKEEEKQKAEEERTYLDDFEIIYSCEVPDVTEWGICSYTKENEKKYAVFSLHFQANKIKPLHFTEEKPLDNKVSFYYDKQIFTGGEKTYIRENVHPTTTYEIELFPNENGKVNKSVITQVVTTTGRVVKSIATEAENIIQTGKIPDGFFTVSAENDTKKEEKENIPEEAKKPVEEEEDETQEDTEEGLNEEITTDDNKEDDVQNREAEIKKKAGESGLVLMIGEKTALVKGEKSENDVPPVIRNSRTMLPARFVGEGLGAVVEWNGEKREVTARKDNIVIRIYIDSDKAYVNGKEEKLDAPAFIENDRTYIPLRFIAENFGADVVWDDESRMVFIAAKSIEK